MKSLWRSSFLMLFAALSAHTPAAAQPANPQVTTAPPPPGLRIVNFKVGSDYYPMLDRPSSLSITADNPDYPRLEAERAQRQASRRGEVSERVEETKARGKLRSNVKIVDDAQWVQVAVKNEGPKTIKAVAWDFAFPRFEGDRLVLRYDVSSKIEIKPGQKKTLKQALPAGARGCEMVVVRADAGGNATKGYYGGVCGDPLAMRDPAAMNQEAVIIKRIEYADGSVWEWP
jgi:hypothetical protein